LRAGYLTALAARTLGVTSMLSPTTPSRFEPEGPQAELREVIGVQEAEPFPLASPRPASARADERPPDAVTGADRPRRGFFDSDVPGQRHSVAGPPDHRAAPGVSEHAGHPAEAAGRRRAADGEPPADIMEPRRGSGPPSGQATPGPVFPDDQPPGWAADLVAATASPLEASGNRVAWHVDAIRADRSRQQARADHGASEPAEAAGTEPTVIVRIGRVDVRAVQAASPPPPTPRARPPAGPPLEEHLRARDRGRR
jgi:hypothetical protein